MPLKKLDAVPPSVRAMTGKSLRLYKIILDFLKSENDVAEIVDEDVAYHVLLAQVKKHGHMNDVRIIRRQVGNTKRIFLVKDEFYRKSKGGYDLIDVRNVDAH